MFPEKTLMAPINGLSGSAPDSSDTLYVANTPCTYTGYLFGYASCWLFFSETVSEQATSLSLDSEY